MVVCNLTLVWCYVETSSKDTPTPHLTLPPSPKITNKQKNPPVLATCNMFAGSKLSFARLAKLPKFYPLKATRNFL